MFNSIEFSLLARLDRTDMMLSIIANSNLKTSSQFVKELILEKSILIYHSRFLFFTQNWILNFLNGGAFILKKIQLYLI